MLHFLTSSLLWSCFPPARPQLSNTVCTVCVYVSMCLCLCLCVCVCVCVCVCCVCVSYISSHTPPRTSGTNVVAKAVTALIAFKHTFILIIHLQEKILKFYFNKKGKIILFYFLKLPRDIYVPHYSEIKPYIGLLLEKK